MTIHRSAKFSDCGKYRYYLRRWWDESKKQVMVIGLNPSTGNHETDDPTIRILINVISHLGYGGFYIVNLYALVSSKPDKLFSVPDAMGDNEYWIGHVTLATQGQIFAWGSFKNTEYRQKKMITLFPDGLCFGKTKDGKPLHPMALMYGGVRHEDVQLIKYRS